MFKGTTGWHRGASRRRVSVLSGGCLILVAVLAGMPGGPALGEVARPPCEAIEAWAVTIDREDRWNPVPSNQRFWLPSSFGGPEFEALFGAPAIEWTLDDVTATRARLHDCATAAHKKKNYEVRNAFRMARAFISGQLKNHLRQVARVGAKMDKQLDALLALPDSVELLQTLAVLRGVQAGNRDSLKTAEYELRRIGGEPRRPARLIIGNARQQSSAAYDEQVLPALNARYEDLRDSYMDTAEGRISDHPAGSPGLAAVDATLKSIREQFGAGLPTEDYATLETIAAAEHAALREAILADAKSRIDGLDASPAALGEASSIVAETTPSLDADGTRGLAAHATARKQAIANALLADAKSGLADVPETLAGMAHLNRSVDTTLGTVSGHLEKERIDAFRATADIRRAAIAEAALSEFKVALDSFGDDADGLQKLAAEAAQVAAWQGVSPDTRSAYEAAVATRRGEIEAAMADAAAAAEETRQKMVVQATKARMDAQRVHFDSLSAVDRELADARRKSLGEHRMAEIEVHAAARKQAIADEILVLAGKKLEARPQTLERLSELMTNIDVILYEVDGAASPEAIETFTDRALDASDELADEVFGDFESQLAELPEDRKGQAQAEQYVAWAGGLRYVEDDLREDYVAAARKRRDEIAKMVAEAEIERRQRVLAAGGDPDLVGYTFADERGFSAIEFVNEERVIIAMVGMRFGGTYEVVGDDIFVEGPNGTVVFKRNGDELDGMGLVLRRVLE